MPRELHILRKNWFHFKAILCLFQLFIQIFIVWTFPTSGRMGGRKCGFWGMWSVWVLGGSWITKFSKKWSLTRSQFFKGVTRKDRGDFYLENPRFWIKNKVKSEIFDDKKVYKQKYSSYNQFIMSCLMRLRFKRHFSHHQATQMICWEYLKEIWGPGWKQ